MYEKERLPQLTKALVIHGQSRPDALDSVHQGNTALLGHLKIKGAPHGEKDTRHAEEAAKLSLHKHGTQSLVDSDVTRHDRTLTKAL